MSDLHGLGMVFVWLLPFLLIAVVVYYLKGTKKENLSARDILDKRYANGEIDPKEYHTKLKELQA